MILYVTVLTLWEIVLNALIVTTLTRIIDALRLVIYVKHGIKPMESALPAILLIKWLMAHAFRLEVTKIMGKVITALIR